MSDIRVHLDLRSGHATMLPAAEVMEIVEVLAASQSQVCVVDLDAAEGKPKEYRLLGDIAKRWPGRFLVSGGIKSYDDAKRLLSLGFAKIVIGSALFDDRGVSDAAVSTFSSSLPSECWDVALDYSGENIVRSGFRKTTTISLKDSFAKLREALPQSVGICLTNARAAELVSSADFSLLSRAEDDRAIWYGGGVRRYAEIEQLRRLGFGSIVGRSLFDENSDYSLSVFGSSKLAERWRELVNRSNLS